MCLPVLMRVLFKLQFFYCHARSQVIGHPETFKTLDSGLRTTGMTNREDEFIHRLS